jgi:hypothetical protein
MLLGEVPSPLPAHAHAISDAHGPPGPLVVRSVPPTDVTNASSAGWTNLAYGLQDLRNQHRDEKTKSNPNTMGLLITPGGNRGTGHFYFALTRI